MSTQEPENNFDNDGWGSDSEDEEWEPVGDTPAQGRKTSLFANTNNATRDFSADQLAIMGIQGKTRAVAADFGLDLIQEAPVVHAAKAPTVDMMPTAPTKAVAAFNPEHEIVSMQPTAPTKKALARPDPATTFGQSPITLKQKEILQLEPKETPAEDEELSSDDESEEDSDLWDYEKAMATLKAGMDVLPESGSSENLSELRDDYFPDAEMNAYMKPINSGEHLAVPNCWTSFAVSKPQDAVHKEILAYLESEEIQDIHPHENKIEAIAWVHGEQIRTETEIIVTDKQTSAVAVRLQQEPREKHNWTLFFKKLRSQMTGEADSTEALDETTYQTSKEEATRHGQNISEGASDNMVHDALKDLLFESENPENCKTFSQSEGVMQNLGRILKSRAGQTFERNALVTLERIARVMPANEKSSLSEELGGTLEMIVAENKAGQFASKEISRRANNLIKSLK